jgi:hypothetical protein
MRSHSHHLALLLLAGALGTLAGGCGQSTVEVREERARAEHRLKPLAPEVAASIQQAGDNDEGFPFPGDRGGRMLARGLTPAGPAEESRNDATSSPKRLPTSPVLEEPRLLLPAASLQMPRLPPSRNGALRPHSLPESLPLFGAQFDLPEVCRFAVGDRISQHGPDANQPVPLPVLALPVPDQSTLEDPTADHSASTAQSAAPPRRETALPFARVSLPDPFENRNAIRLREAPAEQSDPVTVSPRLPGR